MPSRNLARVLVVTLGLAAPSIAVAQPPRDQRPGAQVAGPTEPPPAARNETWKPRRGQVWIAGQWEWRGNKWVWKAGRYERRQKGKRWADGRWDKDGSRWKW